MAQYKMPKVHVGMMVWWHDGGRKSTPPAAAIVTAVADNMVDVSLVLPLSMGLQTRNGVRHVDDPDLRAIDQADVGVWDYTPDTKALIEMGKQLRELTGAGAKEARKAS